MALPPTIPTSFVPHPETPAARSRTQALSLLSLAAYTLLAIAFVLALGVFAYGQFLASRSAGKSAALAAAQASIEQTTVRGFIRLRDRLALGKTLLRDHLAFSAFFASLEKTLPTSVRFSNLQLQAQESGGGARLEATGTAKDFNALAVASQAFAKEGMIKDAVFSNIQINRDASVSFFLSARIDETEIIFTPRAGGTRPSSL